MDQQYLITASFDCFIKIWSPLEGKLLCAMNINHPLPVLWDLNDDQVKNSQRKILFAIRVIDVIFKKFRNDILPSEEKLLSLQPLFNYIMFTKKNKMPSK
jgi:hypothetical protein